MTEVDNPTYSIAVCNYDMADTIEASLRSILDQIDPDDFEVVVVDGGSTDGSREILRRLNDEYSNLHIVLNRSGECDWLGGDRNISFKESRGEYVFESMDTDDGYFDGIVTDFLRVFHAVERNHDNEFFFSGRGINIAPRSLLLDVPYRDVGGAEDRDLWRRLFARDALVWFDHGQVSESLGYDFDLRGEISRDLHGKETEFRTGVTLSSCLRYALSTGHSYILERERPLPLEILKRGYDLVTYPYVYWRARDKKQWPAPEPYQKKGKLERAIAENRRTLTELEDEYGFYLDRSEFSAAGRQAFVEYTRQSK
jgi:glycosyltransferase involved in cell wall biosynthesis